MDGSSLQLDWGPSLVPASREVVTTLEIERLLADGAAVALSISAGKDGQAAAIATLRHLDRIGHIGPRLLIHANLGIIEWPESLPGCERQAQDLGLELVVLRKPSGGLMERFESRWQANLRRYARLETVTVVVPWATPRLRYCSSEQKHQPITRYLRRRFTGGVINVTGVRREESVARSRCTVADLDAKLSKPGAPFMNWRPIADYSTKDVFDEIREAGQVPHVAYTRWGLTRTSCRFCIMSSGADLLASSRNPESAELYRRMVDLEIRSTFAFQGSRWLGDVAPHLLDADRLDAFQEAKRRAARRSALEATLPKGLRFEKGVPTTMLSRADAAQLAEVRTQVAALLDVAIDFSDADSVMAHYEGLLVQHNNACEAQGA